MRRTVKSLVAIMVCVIGSWTFNALLEIVMQSATTVGQTIWLTTRLGAVAINIGCGVNVVLLYNFSLDVPVFSSDYNTAIVKELGPILHLAGKKFVSSMASVQRVNPKFSGSMRSRASAFSRADVSVHVSTRIQTYS
ncbi:hypothetical protein AAVH_23966 [Aphelenchoides avenae]|nr:hypothetical protein AAVH_23966 [Aphelenchus avenae]